jgi:hypothetical protein
LQDSQSFAGRLPSRRHAGGYLITLPHDVLNKRNYLRGPGQSYSDVILRVADITSLDEPQEHGARFLGRPFLCGLVAFLRVDQ